FVGAQGGLERVEHGRRDRVGAAHQSSGSTNTWIVPPHVSPTANASSSEYPNVTTPRGFVPSSTASASVTTAPSTQPPDTEPATSPASLTTIVAPGSRGPEPSTPTTRATATRRPAARQRATSSRTSFTGTPAESSRV